MSTAPTYHKTTFISKDVLIERYSPLVKRIAHHLLSRLPKTVQLEDLIQAGMIGLLGAAENYDMRKGASFETYAGIRIRGMMLDEVRKVDWVPRSVYRNSRRISQAVHELENLLGRDARDHEIAKALGVPLAEYHAMLQDVNSTQIYGFDDVGVNEETINENCVGVSEPFTDLQQNNFRRSLTESMKLLPERERLVLALYYDEELNLKEIGEILEVSESRVCQIHSQAMIRLQAYIAEWKNREE